VAGNQICDVKIEIRGGGESNAWNCRNDERNGDLVEYSETAAIRLGVMRGWLQLYKYNGNLLQNRWVSVQS
jgi:hypothetical protein